MNPGLCLTEKALYLENQLTLKEKRNHQNQSKNDSSSQIHRQLWESKQKVCFQKEGRGKLIFIQRFLIMSLLQPERQNQDNWAIRKVLQRSRLKNQLLDWMKEKFVKSLNQCTKI